MTETVPKKLYDETLAQSISLGNIVRTHETREKRSNRKLDIYRRLIQVGAVVASIVLIIGLFVNHPVMENANTKPVVAVLVVVCLAYAVGLEFARGSTGVVVFLMLAGTSVFSFSIAVAIIAFHCSHPI